VLGFALDISASFAAIPVRGGQMLTSRGIEHKHRPFEPAQVIVAQVVSRYVSEPQVDKECLTGVVHPSVREHVADILEAQIPLRKAPIRMVRNNCDSRFPHPSALRMKPKPLRKSRTERGTPSRTFQLQEVYVQSMR
jgi:hypothetical protein